MGDRVAIGQLNAKGHISGENSRKGRGKWQGVRCKVREMLRDVCHSYLTGGEKETLSN